MISESLQLKIQSAKDFIEEYLSDEHIEKAMLFSGGKDAIVVKHLLIENNVKNIKYYYFSTGIETDTFHDFMKKYHNDVQYLSVGHNIINEWIKRGYLPYPPKDKKEFYTENRKKYSYCCTNFKWNPQKYIVNKSIVIYGVKNIDSRRSKLFNDSIHNNRLRTKYCPIHNWLDDDVWEYIKNYNLKFPEDYSLYGTLRMCPLCPLTLDINSKFTKLNYDLLEKIKQAAFKCFENNIYLQEQFLTAEFYYSCIIDHEKYIKHVYYESEFFIDPENGNKILNVI